MDCRPKMAVTEENESVIGGGGERLGPHYNPVLAWANKWSCRLQRTKLRPSWVKAVCSRSICTRETTRIRSLITIAIKKSCYISSVLVGKTIDLLVCRRLKLRGQNWSRPGADNLLVFRQMVLNDQWPNYWPGRKPA